MLALTVLTIRSNRPASCVERAGVRGREVVVGAEPQPVLLLLQRLGQHGHLGTQGVGDLDAHVAEAAEADDGDLLAGSGAPLAQRRVHRDAGAQQRCGLGRLDAVGDAEDVVGVDDDVGGVATLRGGAVAVGAGVRRHHALDAVLLVTVAAVGALAARVHHAAHADAGADLVAGDVGPDLGDDADDLVARHHRVGLRAPVAVDGVDVGVADAGVLDLDEHVVGSDCSAFDGDGDEGLAGGGRGVGVDLHGDRSPWVVGSGRAWPADLVGPPVSLVG